MNILRLPAMLFVITPVVLAVSLYRSDWITSTAMGIALVCLIYAEIIVHKKNIALRKNGISALTICDCLFITGIVGMQFQLFPLFSTLTHFLLFEFFSVLVVFPLLYSIHTATSKSQALLDIQYMVGGMIRLF